MYALGFGFRYGVKLLKWYFQLLSVCLLMYEKIAVLDMELIYLNGILIYNYVFIILWKNSSFALHG